MLRQRRPSISVHALQPQLPPLELLRLAEMERDLLDYEQETGITMCGLAAAAVALQSGLPRGYEAGLVDYARSGDRDRDYSHSVSYASILITSGQDH